MSKKYVLNLDLQNHNYILCFYEFLYTFRYKAYMYCIICIFRIIILLYQTLIMSDKHLYGHHRVAAICYCYFNIGCHSTK